MIYNDFLINFAHLWWLWRPYRSAGDRDSVSHSVDSAVNFWSAPRDLSVQKPANTINPLILLFVSGQYFTLLLLVFYFDLFVLCGFWLFFYFILIWITIKKLMYCIKFYDWWNWLNLKIVLFNCCVLHPVSFDLCKMREGTR